MQQQMNLHCLEDLKDTLEKLRRCKPDDRSELARRYQVTITELEKGVAE